MGKRKAKKAPAPKKVKLKLEKTFSCPFCNHEKAVECRLDQSTKIGYIQCRVCEASFKAPINSLSQPIDVYSDWIDACEAENAVEQPNNDRDGE